MDAFIALLENSKQLRKLAIEHHSIHHINDVERFCSAVHDHNSLMYLNLRGSYKILKLETQC